MDVINRLFSGPARKRSVLYTIIAITLLLSVIFATSLSYQFKYREQRAIIETRVNTMDIFMSDLQKDMEKGVRVAGYRALLGLTNYVLESTTFVDDTEQRFEELFYYGTIYGNWSFVMNNNTFLNWTQKMGVLAEEIGLDVDFEVVTFNVEQISPWEIKVTTNVSVQVEDNRDVASWKGVYGVSSTVLIDGFEDPMYAVKTGNALSKIINRTYYENNYVSGNDTENLELHMNRTYFTAYNGAPSFFMRFEGDLNASEYGIESLVNKEEVGAYHPCPEGTSNADTLYWQCSAASTWEVEGMPSWFYLDNESGSGDSRHEKYEVEDLV